MQVRQCRSLLFLITLLWLLTPASSTAANLLSNPDFEIVPSVGEAPPGWLVVSGRLEHDLWVKPGHGRTGDHGFVIHTSRTEALGIRSDYVSVVPGKQYQASVSVFATSGNTPTLFLEFWDATERRIAYESATTATFGTWTVLETALQAPAETEWVTVSLHASPASLPGRIMFDEASVVEDVSYAFSVATDRDDAIYDLDEPITFVVTGTRGGSPINGTQVTWVLSNDGNKQVARGTTPLVDGKAHITGTLDEPGFLQIQVTPLVTGETTPLVAAAAVAPESISPSLPVPDDFDAFWDEQKALLAAVPPIAHMSRVNSGIAGVEAYNVRVDAVGQPVSGYFAKPTGAETGSLPAIITFHGAGVRSSILGTTTGWAKEGMLAMDINAHGILNGQPAAYYSDLASGDLLNYRLRGRDSRDTFYFREMFLRVIRAIDFITSQPEWDGRTLVLYGTSQGGAQALAGAGLDPRVSFVVAGVPAMADLTGMVVDRPMGWPRMDDIRRVYSISTAAQNVIDTLRYFDVMNFATRTTADALFTVGFIDPTCPPTTVYAAYNNVNTTKQIYNDIAAGHVNTPQALHFMRSGVLDHVAKLKSGR